MADYDLDLAFALERFILGNQLHLECNCILDVLCTMPHTYWVRVARYDHRCPRHPRGGGNHLLLREPAWVTTVGELVSPEEFTTVFNKLVDAGIAVLMPGIVFDQGRQRKPSMLSLEQTHYIDHIGRTQKLARE